MGAKSRTHFASLEKNYVYRYVCGGCSNEDLLKLFNDTRGNRYARCAVCRKNQWLLLVREEKE